MYREGCPAFPGEKIDPPPTAAEKWRFSVPEHELVWENTVASGPGGQNRQKTSTKARLRWHIGRSGALNERQKETLRQDPIIKRHLVKGKQEDGNTVTLECEAERSLEQNKNNLRERLNNFVTQALLPKKERKPTRTPQSAKEKRLAIKKAVGGTKAGRNRRRVVGHAWAELEEK